MSVLTTSGKSIFVDTSDEICLKYGFLHGDTVIHPNGFEVKIAGVSPGNDGQDALWYEIHHTKTKGLVCYYGKEKNLIEAGFTLKEDLTRITYLVLSDFPKDDKKQKVFFVVQNSVAKFYWGTDNNSLDLDVIQKWVKNGALKKLKEPIFLKKGQGLWCGGKQLDLYIGEKNADNISFSTVPLGRFYDLVIK